MKRSMQRALVVMVAAVLGLMWPQGAVAQMRVSASAGNSLQSPVTRRGVEAYAKILKLDEDQKAAMQALFEGYRAGIKEVREETKQMMEEMQQEFADSMDMSVWKDAAKRFEPLTKRTQDLERQFFADLQSLLTSEQAERVPKLERYRRRETNLRYSFVAGARVDLIEIAERLELAGSPEVAQALESYELDLDRALVTRENLLKELEKENEKAAEQAMNMDFSAIGDMMKKMMDADKPLREINKTHVRRITDVLPEEKRATFEKEYRQRAYPAAYREPHIVKEFEAALGFSDLSASQREEIARLKSSYESEASGLNQQWAAAMEERDDKGIVGFMAFMGGGQENPTAEPRKARRELDKNTTTKLHALLNEEQLKRLPEAPKLSQQQQMMEAMGMDMDPEMMGSDGWMGFSDDED